MAKDDYFVIVYQLLKYLYDCLKEGNRPEADHLRAEYFRIPASYWLYILTSLHKEGLVDGIHFVKTKDGIVLSDPTELMIQPKGIEYLFENTLIQRAKKTLSEIKDIVPFI